MSESSPDLRYPIGPFSKPKSLTAEDRREAILAIAQTPRNLRAAVAGLTDAQLDTPYRPGGWTVRQVAHHVPDSHINAYVRFKLALTEDAPVIKPYHEHLWAELEEARTAPVDVSLDLLDALHRRWVLVLENMREADFARTIQHPELGTVSLNTYLSMYAWHGRHHAAHIQELRGRMGW